MAAPTTPRWRPHEVRYEMAAPVTRSVTPRRMSQRPRPREGSVTSYSAVSFFYIQGWGASQLFPGGFFLWSSEQDPVFNGVARRRARFIPFPGWTFFFSTVLSRLFSRTDWLRNWVVKAERDMIVYQRRTGSSPCIWRRSNLGAYCAIICRSSFSILMNSSPKLLYYALCPLYYPLLFA